MSEPEYTIIPSDPATREKLRAVIKDISDQMTIIEGYRNVIKEAIEACSEETNVPAKYIRKLANSYHRQSFEKEAHENDEFESLYEAVLAE